MFRVLYKRNEARVMNYLSSDRWKCRTKLVHLPKVFLSFYKDFHELDIIPTVFYVRKIYCSQCLGWYYIAKNGKRPFFVRKWNGERTSSLWLLSGLSLVWQTGFLRLVDLWAFSIGESTLQHHLSLPRGVFTSLLQSLSIFLQSKGRKLSSLNINLFLKLWFDF